MPALEIPEQAIQRYRGSVESTEILLSEAFTPSFTNDCSNKFTWALAWSVTQRRRSQAVNFASAPASGHISGQVNQVHPAGGAGRE